jgi:hypothetical protein
MSFWSEHMLASICIESSYFMPKLDSLGLAVVKISLLRLYLPEVEISV